MNVLLLSTYDLGHQPFALASPAAWIRDSGAQVTTVDLSIDSLTDDVIGASDLVAIHLPMHTATRLAVPVFERVRAINPSAYLCAYGLYATLNAGYLETLGVRSIVGGEFERALSSLTESRREKLESNDGLENSPGAGATVEVSVERLRFRIPDRSGLPPLHRYAKLVVAEDQHRVAGYTEASRGCLHLCRHCPIVPVYGGRFRIVERGVVLADVRQQVAGGARHITFGDPDFFNGPGHSLAIVESMHAEFPDLTYDVTIKIEHLLRYSRHLPRLAKTGCLFIVSAAESVDDEVLRLLDKGHTAADFREAVRLCREFGLDISPTFIPFTPWTDRSNFRRLLRELLELDLVPNVPPVQLAIRLLIPARSRLLELPEISESIEPFDESSLCHPWRNTDSSVDLLQKKIFDLVETAAAGGEAREETFRKIWMAAHGPESLMPPPCERDGEATEAPRRAPIPHLTEPWYC